MRTNTSIGKHVLVTGAGGGLGAALCERYAAMGAHIIAIDINVHGLEALVERIRPLGTTITTYVCDLSDIGQLEETMLTLRERHTTIDIIVHNAGITHRSAFRTTDYTVIKKVLDVNLLAPIYITKMLLEALIASQGQLIVLSSVAGIAPLIGRTGYSSSKHALHGFFDSLRTEVEALGVDILLVCPSFIDTGIERNALNEKGERINRPKVKMGKSYTPTEVADTIVRGANRRKRLLLIGKIAKMSYIIARLLPKTYAKIMTSRFQKEILQGNTTDVPTRI